MEWATAIINSLKHYLATNTTSLADIEHYDATIAIFAKCLKNQVDEGFYYVQQQITQSLRQSAKDALREKWPLKSEPDIKKLLGQLTTHKVKLDDALWPKILAKLYPEGNLDV